MINLPQPGDYIDIHTHGAIHSSGVFIVENLMAHEKRLPEDLPDSDFSLGIHPWFLDEVNYKELLSYVHNSAGHSKLIAIGEAGYDKLRGPAQELQREVFEEQVRIAEKYFKPVIIHCVRAWEELLASYKKLKPKTPWLIHGFRGNKELADQLLSKGMYLSFWYDFVIRPESTGLLKQLPSDRIFLETDGSQVDIRTIYSKVANDLDLAIDELKSIINSNFKDFFNIPDGKQKG